MALRVRSMNLFAPIEIEVIIVCSSGRLHIKIKAFFEMTEKPGQTRSKPKPTCVFAGLNFHNGGDCCLILTFLKKSLSTYIQAAPVAEWVRSRYFSALNHSIISPLCLV